MNKVLQFLLVFNLFAVFSICQAQSSWRCNTVDDNTPLLSEKTQSKSTSLTSISCDKKIRVYFHVIRRSNSTGGLTSSQVTQLLTNLNSDYSALGISFIEKGRSYINNDNYFNGSYDETKFSQLVSTNRQSDAINIYLIQPDFAKADNIPSNALAIGGSFALTSVISHEMGHCLGLYHTHRGTVIEGGTGPNQCPELVNGTNGAICGDYVIDTPADPNKWSGCTYSGTNLDANGQTYNPLNDNIMSYVPPSCLNQLTMGQKSRIHTSIEESNSLLATLVIPEISGPDQFCTTATYTSPNLSQGQNVTWSISPSNFATLTTSGNQVTVTPSLGDGQATLTATISTGCGTKQVLKEIVVGIPDHLINVLEYQGILPVSVCYAYTNYSFEVKAIDPNGVYPYYTYEFASTASYIWRVIHNDPYGSNTIYELGTYGYQDNPSFAFEQAGEYTLTLDIINNNCNYHIRSFVRGVTVQDWFGYTVSPNPSSDNITIESATNSTAKETKKALEIREVELADKMGIVRHRQKFTGGVTTANLSVNTLPNDLYILRIFDGKMWHSHKVLIQH